MNQANRNFAICMIRPCVWSKKLNPFKLPRKAMQNPPSLAVTRHSPLVTRPNDPRPSISVVAFIAAATGRLVAREARPSARVCLFFDAIGSWNSEYHEGAHWRIFDITALVDVGLVHRCAGTAAPHQERNQGYRQRRGYRRGY